MTSKTLDIHATILDIHRILEIPALPHCNMHELPLDRLTQRTPLWTRGSQHCYRVSPEHLQSQHFSLRSEGSASAEEHDNFSLHR